MLLRCVPQSECACASRVRYSVEPAEINKERYKKQRRECGYSLVFAALELGGSLRAASNHLVEVEGIWWLLLWLCGGGGGWRTPIRPGLPSEVGGGGEAVMVDARERECIQEEEKSAGR